MKMKKCFILLPLLLLGVTSTLVSCGGTSSVTSTITEKIDYASQFKLDTTSNRKRATVTVHQTVDGDTTHFKCDVPEITTSGILKARYLGIDTPESTGKVQPYGKKASDFTKERISNAVEIIVESDSDTWNADSTGERYLLWVWYKPSKDADFRLLNLEIMQEGLAMAKNIGGTCYADIMNKAYSQAMALKLNYYSGKPDEGFYYGDAQTVDLKEIRTNIDSYVGTKVQFNALVTRVSGQTAYVQEFFGEDERYYGISVYMGFDVSVQSQVKVGYYISFVGNVEYYEAGKSYQLSNLTYMATKPDYRDNLKVLEKGVEVKPYSITPTQLVEEGDMIMSTYVSMNNLTVTDTYTTNNGGDNDGALTLTCKSEDNKTITVRTSVLYHEDGTMVTADELMGKTINVIGIVDTFDGDVQIHVFLLDDITFSD